MFKQLQKKLSIILMLVSVASLAADKGESTPVYEEKNTNQLIILMKSDGYTPPPM